MPSHLGWKNAQLAQQLEERDRRIKNHLDLAAKGKCPVPLGRLGITPGEEMEHGCIPLFNYKNSCTIRYRATKRAHTLKSVFCCIMLHFTQCTEKWTQSCFARGLLNSFLLCEWQKAGGGDAKRNCAI